MKYLSLIGRKEGLFSRDIQEKENFLSSEISKRRFLVIGGAGSIGQSVSKEIFKRNPLSLHVVDLSENNMVELVRDIRSTLGYNSGEFKTFSIDSTGHEMKAMVDSEGPYDYIFNLSALKHVRSEKDPYTLMRLVIVNIFNTIEIANISKKNKSSNYFCVSSDKAANPFNMMGASKKIMEMFLMKESLEQNISMARFANVAFSDGSLLHGFNQRYLKQQPLAAPYDIKRYFVTPQESGELCLLSGLMGENRDIFFPKLDEKLHLTTFSDLARKFLKLRGYEPYECNTEEEAREGAKELISEGRWPCYFFKSDTTGEKDYEEFFTEKEELDLEKFHGIGIIKNSAKFDEEKLDYFSKEIRSLINNGAWKKEDILNLFLTLLPDFNHKETGKNLDDKM